MKMGIHEQKKQETKNSMRLSIEGRPIQKTLTNLRIRKPSVGMYQSMHNLLFLGKDAKAGRVNSLVKINANVAMSPGVRLRKFTHKSHLGMNFGESSHDESFSSHNISEEAKGI